MVTKSIVPRATVTRSLGREARFEKGPGVQRANPCAGEREDRPDCGADWPLGKVAK